MPQITNTASECPAKQHNIVLHVMLKIWLKILLKVMFSAKTHFDNKLRL